VHSDGIQGYNATGSNVIHNVTLIFETECGTSPFYIGYGSGGVGSGNPPINTGTYDIDRLLVGGISLFAFRLQVASSVAKLHIVDGSWIPGGGPILNRCSVINPWDADIVTVDPTYRITSTMRDQPCDTEESE